MSTVPAFHPSHGSINLFPATVSAKFGTAEE
jgi:hypothetical protein